MSTDETRDLIVAGLLSFPDDGHLMPTFVGPRPASLLELIARHVGPQGAANVLRVDDDVGHPEVVAGFLGALGASTGEKCQA